MLPKHEHDAQQMRYAALNAIAIPPQTVLWRRLRVWEAFQTGPQGSKWVTLSPNINDQNNLLSPRRLF
ncbi:MAG: hypothetical protein EBS61_08245 [Betaproteobacteria bacterium]|nr:hypothetical protein [Betaproteobacteria bacterium]